ncbi:41487_t:CDS:2, partial [Gigaspora margarita]
IEFALEVVENIIRSDNVEEIEHLPSFIKVSPQKASLVESWRRRMNIEEFLDPYYVSGKSCDEMKDRGSIPKNELNDLIDGYLEDLDKLIPKSRRGENYTLGNCNRKGIVIPALKDPPKPRKTRPTITEVLDTYYVPDKPEKKPPQNVALGLGIDLKPLQTLLNECNDIMQRWVLEKEKCNELKQKEKMKLKNVPEDVVGDKPRSAKDNEAKKNEIINYDYYWIGLKSNKNTASDCHPKPYTPKPCSWNGASKEEIMAFDLDVYPIEDNRSETKDLESLKDNYRENSGTKPKDPNGPYTPKPCSRNIASAIKEKKVAFDLDPIKDKCSETKNHEGLDENPQQSINLTHRTVFNPGGEVGRSH